MKFYLHRLGCPKNDVDADYISARLIKDGHEAVEMAETAEAVIVNTCGFILPAKEESIAEIFRLSQLKEEGVVKKLYAAGCLTQRYGQELLADIPELDGVFGVGALDELSLVMGGEDKSNTVFSTAADRMQYIAYERRFVSDRLPYAYMKISDGCNRTCAFCAIPGIRGHYRSRPLESIINEARFLVEQGKKELILVSQESTLYGHDLKDGTDLLQLLRELDKIEGLEWIRVMYLYPTHVSDEMISYFAAEDNKTLNYFDIPLQHINDEILKGMDRHTTRQQIESLLHKIRNTGDNATIRTAFIVGFPGETEAQFDELVDFVESFGFDRLGAFLYSAEEGTTANDMADMVDPEIAQKRLDRLMSVQQGLAFNVNNNLIGSVRQVIIDTIPTDGPAMGRTRADCPDIDQNVLVTRQVVVGELCRVKIESFEGYDLTGSKVEAQR